MSRIRLHVGPRQLAQSPPFAIENGWQPKPVPVLATDPPDADVIAGPLPTRGGMRIVVYNRSLEPVWVELPWPGTED